MLKVNEQTVIKRIKEDGKWEGYITPSKCRPNPGNPFNMAMEVSFKRRDLEKEYPEAFDNPFRLKLNAFEFYNCNAETGKEIHFYEGVED